MYVAGILQTLIMFVPLVIASLLPRQQTEAICPTSEFGWAFNEQQMSPCQVASSAQGACNTGWDVPKLNPSEQYNFHSDACTCSWAVYNLLMACTACQGDNPSILTWASVHTSANCSMYYSTTFYFPPDTPIPGNIRIPSWAAVNPSGWTDGTFNVDQAKTVAGEGKPDLDPTQQSPKAKPVGAIAGGVVGGVLVLLLGAACVAWMIIRRRKATQSSGPHRPPMHLRSTSDLSQRSMVSAYTSSFGNAVPPPSSPTRSTAARSVFGSAQGSIFSVSATSRQVVPPVPSVPAAVLPEGRIDPYIVSPTTPTPTSPRPLNRKTSSDTSIQPVSRPDEGPSDTGRRRLNPPTYTASVANQAISITSRNARHGHRSGQTSQDTQQSWGSGGRTAGPSGGDRSSSVPVHSRQTSAETVASQADSQVPLA